MADTKTAISFRGMYVDMLEYFQELMMDLPSIAAG